MYVYPEAVLVDTNDGTVVSTGPDGAALTFATADYLAHALNAAGLTEVRAFTLTPGTPAQTPGGRLLNSARGGDAA